MRQFLKNNDLLFRDLEERAQFACIRFKSQEMPPGCTPSYADIGFEVSGNPPFAKLYVEKGIRYVGSIPELGEWFRAGIVQFQNFYLLREWLFGPLNQAYNQNINSYKPTRPSEATKITNMTAVCDGISNIQQPLYLDWKRYYLRGFIDESSVKITLSKD